MIVQSPISTASHHIRRSTRVERSHHHHRNNSNTSTLITIPTTFYTNTQWESEGRSRTRSLRRRPLTAAPAPAPTEDHRSRPSRSGTPRCRSTSGRPSVRHRILPLLLRDRRRTRYRSIWISSTGSCVWIARIKSTKIKIKKGNKNQ